MYKTTQRIYCYKGVDIDVEMIVYNIHRLNGNYKYFDASEMKLTLKGKELGNEDICARKVYTLVRRPVAKKFYVNQAGEMLQKLG